MPLEAISGKVQSEPLNRNFSFLDSQKMSKEEAPQLNVRDKGAVGDGLTDNTSAFIAAVEEINAKGGGSIYIPFGDYLIHGFVELFSNISFFADKGTRLRKTELSTSSYLFVTGMTRGTTGYGGGAQNLHFEGITFHGRANSSTEYNSLSNTFNHAQHVVFRDCRFIDCITTGHALDLSGCDDILVDNCSFEGAYNILGREYTEAIQIDSSTSTSLSGNFSNYDALPTKNVTVRNSRFIPSYNDDGSIKNYAPNPIGNHGFTGGMYYTGIHFENNLVEDGWMQSGDNWRAWIHFYGLKDSKFINNRIVNTQTGICSPLGFYSSSAGRYDPVTGDSTTGEPLPCVGIEVKGNTFEGFNNPSNPALIRAYGIAYNGTTYRTSKIKVVDNQFTNNAPADMSGGANLVQINDYTDATVKDNKVDLAGRVASIYSGWNASISGNEFSQVAINAFYVSSTDVLNVFNNTGNEMRRPLEILGCRKGNVSGNVFDNVLQSGTENYANKLRNLVGFLIQGNYTGTAYDSGLYHGYYVYDTDGTSNHVKVYDNMAVGFENDVNTTGTISNYSYRA